MPSTNRASVEEQLALYRQRKRQEEETKAKKERVWLWFTWIMSFGRGTDSSASDTADEAEQPSQNDAKGLARRRGLHTASSTSSESVDQSDDNSPTSSTFQFSSYTTLDWTILSLKVILWLVLVKLFIIIEFGAVFFIFSAFAFMWYNMRSGSKKKGEISAYSVFNPNCETIDGTFTAEQFERELLHKM